MRAYAAVSMVVCAVILSQFAVGGESRDLLEGVPYKDAAMGKRMLVDEDYLLMMQAALKPGQMVPQHNADSNVHIIVLEGEVVINLAGNNVPAGKGDLVRVEIKTPMNIRNVSEANATFVIIKTPHPSRVGK